MTKTKRLGLPVVSLGAEFLVMGMLMRRNVLAYKAPPGNEGYDLICIHPNPRVSTKQVRVQVKSRYATDSGKSFPLKAASMDAFDYLVVVFLNIGKFKAADGGLTGAEPPAFYTLPREVVKKYHRPSDTWEKVHLRGALAAIELYRDDLGFEHIAKELGVDRPRKVAE